MKFNLSILLVFILGSIPFGILFYGFQGYKHILSENPCEMTYAYPFNYETKLEWKQEGYRLFKVSRQEGEVPKGHPVLFIPGHRGSHVQVRSFASEMHNGDHHFQYFSIDFNNDIVGLHGKDLMLKAAFVNEALRIIKKLYAKPELKVTLLGHSYGGMIAKTSVLLSNHPNCMVDSVIMLGTPNIKPAHGVDASLTTLFNHVNKGYYTGFYNNVSCGYYNVSSRFATSRVTLQPTCTACIQNISLVSISGGEIDFEVVPASTNIFDVAARPRNISSLPAKRQGGLFISTLSKYMNGIRVSMTKRVYSLIFGDPQASEDPVFNSTATNATTTIEEEQSQPTVRLPSNSSYSFITKELWEETIVEYTEPRHACYRSSQFVKVGFPIDHYALLWCRELLAEISTAMRKLRKNPRISMHKLFNVHNSSIIQESMNEVQPLEIRELSLFVGRNASNTLWQIAARTDEQYLLDILGRNYFQYFCLNFFLRHWSGLLTGFFASLIFALSMKVLAIVLALDTRIPADSYLADFELLILVTKRIYQVTQENNLFYVLFGVFSIFLYYLRQFLTKDIRGTMLLLVNWGLSFLGGLFLRVVLVAMIRLFRGCLNLLLQRKGGKKRSSEESSGEAKKTSRNFIKRYFGKFVWNYLNEIFLFSLWSWIYFVYHWNDDVPSTSLLVFTSLSVVLYTTSVVEWMYLSVITTKNHLYAKRSQAQAAMIEYVDEEILLVVFCLFVAALPALKFCVEFTFLKSSLKNEAALYDLLIPDHIQYCIILIATHLLLRRLCSKKHMIKIHPMASLMTLLDKPVKENGCLHEDGGVTAIFEEVVNTNEQTIGKHSICIGATYKVIWCSCKENRNFKTMDEWCEWCRCAKCNPAGSYGYQQPTMGNSIAINLDLALGLVLFALSFYVMFFIHDEVYTSLYSFAYAIAALVARSFFHKRTIEFTL